LVFISSSLFLDRRLEWYKAANVSVFRDDSRELGVLRLSFAAATVGVFDAGDDSRNDAVDIRKLLVAAASIGDDVPEALFSIILRMHYSLICETS
jgi:hypothetical protein